MMGLGAILLLFSLFASGFGELDDVAETLPPPINATRGPNCSWRHNISDTDQLTAQKVEVLETCLYYYLVNRDLEQTGDTYKLFLKAPWEYPLAISVERMKVQQVDLVDEKAAQFNIHGEVTLSWVDDRLKWNATEWKTESFLLHDNHHIWTPVFTDDSGCTTLDGCISKVIDIEVASDGVVTATLIFRYPSYCGTNYYYYPEETNDCCLYLNMMESERRIEYKISTKSKDDVNKPVAITTVEKQKDITVLTNVATSIWKVVDRTVDVVKLSGFRAQFLRICVHAKKDMSTLRVALRIPATIATLLMLASPLFGDLRTQSFVKLATLMLQTVCFLFLCSIAPPNGFAGHKPKIYSFYEFLFVTSSISIIVNLIALALCRVKRTLPPSHNLYLMAKLINRFLCCIEPDRATNYMRYIEGASETGASTDLPHSSSDPVDHTLEWQHLYIAGNNLISGIVFSLFCSVVIFDLL